MSINGEVVKKIQDHLEKLKDRPSIAFELDQIEDELNDLVRDTEPTYDYEVILSCNFEGRSPEEATREFIQWLQGDNPYDWTYKVNNIDTGGTAFVDGWDLRKK